jgi:hypothetical protein
MSKNKDWQRSVADLPASQAGRQATFCSASAKEVVSYEMMDRKEASFLNLPGRVNKLEKGG